MASNLPKLKSWQVPFAADTEANKLGWLNEATQEGQNYNRSKRGFVDYKVAFDIISGKSPANASPTYRSQLTTGRLKRNAKEIIGAVANIRPIWAFQSANSALADNCAMMNSVNQAIYFEQQFDQGLKNGIQWSALTGTGWIWPKYRRPLYGTKRQANIEFHTYGSPSVLPVQLPSNNNYQEAYAVTIMDEMPIAMAHAMFPAFQERLRPTSSRYWYDQEIRRAAKGNLMQRMFNAGMKRNEDDYSLSDLFIPIRYTFVIDLTINETGQTIPMGEAGAPWFYEVPYVGGPLPNNPTKFADKDDARLYPYRRLLISSENCCMYDGPAFDWTGKFPATAITLDKWVFDAVGFNLVSGAPYHMQKSIDELERGVMDKHAAALDPALAYDLNAVERNQARSFDPMKPRARVPFDGQLTDKPFQDVLPESYRKVDPSTPIYIAHLEETMDYYHALKDVMALAKARAGGGVDDYQKLMEADGPIVQDITRNVEAALTEIGSNVGYLILEYYDTPRIMRLIGADKVARSVFDFDPTKLVPSHMPGENKDNPSTTPMYQRARWFAENLTYYITPHSAHEITQMAYKLLLIQLRKAGVQIDSQTIATSCNIANFGELDGNTVLDKWKSEQFMIGEIGAKLKILVQDLIASGVGFPAMGNAMNNTEANPVGVPKQEGRPSTQQESPRIVSKDGGARSTVSESGA